MALGDETTERTIPPTQLRLAEARRRGIVARSTDLTAAAVTVGALALAAVFGPRLLTSLTGMVAALLAGGPPVSSPQAVGALLWKSAAPLLTALAALCLSVAAVAVLANLLQVGLLAAPRRLKPDWQRISPAVNLRRMVSKRSAIRLIFTAAKLATVGALSYWTIRSRLPEIVESAGMGAAELAAHAGRLILSLGLKIGLAMLALAMLDVLYQRWQHRQDLRMTRRELLDEMKRGRGGSAFGPRQRNLAHDGPAGPGRRRGEPDN